MTMPTHEVRKSTDHTFHFLVTVFTFGLWGVFVWLPITLWHVLGPKKKTTTHYC